MSRFSRFRAPALAVLGALLALSSAACEKDDEPTYGDRMVDAMDRGKASGARGDLQVYSVAITQYVTATGQTPEATTIDELARILEEAGTTRRVSRKDPWGNPYTYETDGDGYVLRSSGDDGVFGTEDDIEVVDGQVTMLPEGLGTLR